MFKGTGGNQSDEQRRKQGNAQHPGSIGICMWGCVKAAYRFMAVRSLGSCPSGPTRHWMDIKLYLSRHGRWRV